MQLLCIVTVLRAFCKYIFSQCQWLAPRAGYFLSSALCPTIPRIVRYCAGAPLTSADYRCFASIHDRTRTAGVQDGSGSGASSFVPAPARNADAWEVVGRVRSAIRYVFCTPTCCHEVQHHTIPIHADKLTA